MYRLTYELREVVDGYFVSAVFEKCTGRKTQRLVEQGKTLRTEEGVRIESHAEACQVMDAFVRVFWDAVTARLDDKPLW